MSFRDQIVAVLVAQPGSSAARLKEALEELGVPMGKNEPASTLNVLKTQGRVRHEGDWPARVYFAVEGVAAPAKGGSKPKAERAGVKQRPAKAVADATGENAMDALANISGAENSPLVEAPAPTPRKGVLRKAATAAELSPYNVRSIPATQPALTTAADITRQELAETIIKHLGEDDGWDSAEQIAKDLGEARQPVALAIADLMKAGRVTRRADTTGRWVYRDKREGDEVQVTHSSPVAEVAAPAELAKTQTADDLSFNGKSGAESFAPAPVTRAEVVVEADGKLMSVGEALSRMKFALKDPVPVDLPSSIGLEITALEDLMGLACDAQAPHRAIKALVVASSSLRRAVAALQPRAA